MIILHASLLLQTLVAVAIRYVSNQQSSKSLGNIFMNPFIVILMCFECLKNVKVKQKIRVH